MENECLVCGHRRTRAEGYEAREAALDGGARPSPYRPPTSHGHLLADDGGGAQQVAAGRLQLNNAALNHPVGCLRQRRFFERLRQRPLIALPGKDAEASRVRTARR
jgi:hypothetical protein